jgi:hypothetical protein
MTSLRLQDANFLTEQYPEVSFGQVQQFISLARRFSSRAWWKACCSVKEALICDTYRGFANTTLAFYVLAVTVSGGRSEEGSGDIVGGDTAHRFPLSDDEVSVVSGT